MSIRLLITNDGTDPVRVTSMTRVEENGKFKEVKIKRESALLPGKSYEMFVHDDTKYIMEQDK
jgi:hypothetical protein